MTRNTIVSRGGTFIRPLFDIARSSGLSASSGPAPVGPQGIIALTAPVAGPVGTPLGGSIALQEADGPAGFSLSVAPPATISPASGVLVPGEPFVFTVTPNEPGLHIVSLVNTLGLPNPSSVAFTATAVPAEPPAPPGPITAADFLNSGFRGVNSYAAYQVLPDVSHFDSLAAMGFNLARVSFSAVWNGTAYVIPSEQTARMDIGLARFAERDIPVMLMVALDVVDMPFGNSAKEAAYVALMASVGVYVAAHPIVCAVDMLNEPLPPNWPADSSPGAFTALEVAWRNLCNLAVPAMRAAAPDVVVIYEVGLGSIPTNWTGASLPTFTNYVLSPHIYIRYEITHQGIPEWQAGQPLPVLLPYNETERGYTLADIAIVAEAFPGVPVCVGEFSCANWTPNAATYVADSIVAYEDAGFSWLFHAWRSAPMWDAEAVPDGRAASPSTGLPLTRSADAPMVTVLREALALPAGQYVAPPPPQPPPPPPPPAPDPGVALTTVNLRETGGASGAFPFTAAVLLTPGQLPAGQALQSPDDGTLRGAVLSTYPDGSAALAVVGGNASLSANGIASFRLQAGSPPAGTVLTSARIATLAPAAFIVFSGGVSATVTLNPAAAPERIWWATSEHICARYRQAVGSHPTMEVVWDVHAFANSSRVHVEATVENAKINVSSPVNPTAASYSAVVTIGGVAQPAVASSAGPEGSHTGSRAWYASGWVGGAVAVHAMQDIVGLQKHPLLFKLDQASNVDMAFYVGDAYTPWSTGRQRPAYMGNGGDHASIGPLTQWDTRLLQTGDYRAARASQASALACLGYNINHRNQATGRVPTISEVAGKSMNGSNNWPKQSNPDQAMMWEVMHHPAAGLMAFASRPTPVFIELAQKIALWNALWANNDNANPGGINTTGLFASGDYPTRGRAWGLRSLAHAVFLTPDGDAWKTAGKASLAVNADYLLEYTTDTKAKLNVMWEGDPEAPQNAPYATAPAGASFGIAAWMYEYLIVELHKIASAQLLTGTDQTKLTTLANWTALFPVRWINEQPNGGWRYIPYATTMGRNPTTIDSLTTWTAMRAYHLTGNPPAAFGGWFSTDQAGDFDYTLSSYNVNTSAGAFYPSYFWPALVAAVERGVAGAEAAWATVQSNLTTLNTWRQGFATDPRYGYAPRNISAANTWISAVAVNTWGMMPMGTTWASLDPRNDGAINPNGAGNTAPWSGSQGHIGHITAWNGGVSDGEGTWTNGVSGGHGDVADNAAYRLACDLALPAFGRISIPSGALPAGILLPLVVGGQLVLGAPDGAWDGRQLQQHLETAQATMLLASPEIISSLLDAGFRARGAFRLLCNGPRLDRALANRVHAAGSTELWALHGAVDAAIASIERSLIRQALQHSEGNVSQTAKLLRLQRTTLIEKLQKYELRSAG